MSHFATLETRRRGIALRGRNFQSFSRDISSAQDTAHALALAGADFRVGRTKLYARATCPGAIPLQGTATALFEVPDARGMWKLSPEGKPQAFLGTVGAKYEPLQNVAAFEAASVLAGEGSTFDRSYVSSDSCQTVLRMKVCEKDILGDKAVGYVTMLNSHDGSTGFLCLDGMFRFACNNEWAGLLSRATRRLAKRHTSGIRVTVQQARLIMTSIRQDLEDVRALAEKTVNIHVSESRFLGLVEELLPYPTEATDRQKVVVNEQRSTMFRCFSAPDLANFLNSGWAALQAVADFSSHLGQSQRESNPDNMVKKLLEVSQAQPLVAKARELVLALN